MIALTAPRPFAELFTDRAQLAHVTNTFIRVIGLSFAEHQMRQQTQAEIKRRFEICERWFRVLRGDKKWTVDRCLSAIPHALRAELAGGTYTPDSRSVWVPSDGAP